MWQIGRNACNLKWCEEKEEKENLNVKGMVHEPFSLRGYLTLA